LYQGDYDIETVFSDDPLETAMEWQSLGAPRVHIVDLDGAIAGVPVNLEVINSLAAGMLIPTQLGGGIRDIRTVEQLLKAGIERVILGTAAVEDPTLVKEACRKYQESIIVGIDTREGMITVRGWQQETELSGIEFAKSMTALGVRRFLCTDVGRTGTLSEPNFSGIAELIEAVKLPVIASGGISTLTHLKMLKQLGAEAAIIGKALYTGDISLKQALAAVE
jgi:phosphoribosylformimino-5-aminoimidazole carboxamide ribotide isomerase